MEQIPNNNSTNILFDRIESTINTLRRRIERILDVERINSKKLPLKIQPINLDALCSNIYENFQGYAASKNIQLNIEHQISAKFVAADQEYLNQAVENLVSNAIKFSDAGKVITIKTSETPSKTRIHVIDYGPGISRKEQKQLFKKYSRLSAKPTGKEKSTGLGLAIVKRYTEAMNGTVWCMSEYGKGAEFILEFEKAMEEKYRLSV